MAIFVFCVNNNSVMQRQLAKVSELVCNNQVSVIISSDICSLAPQLLSRIFKYSKTCVNDHSKIDKTRILKTNSLMKVKSIAECPPIRAFYNTLDLHRAIIGLEKQFSVFLYWTFYTQGLEVMIFE